MALEFVFIGIIVLVVIFLLWLVLTYNRLVTLRNRIDNAWAQIDVQLKRRYDLIPNLVETVKGYMKHEKGTLTEITKMRSALISGNPQERDKTNNMLTGALKTIFAVAENYPQLRASENFQSLQEELSGTENKIAYIRTAYNDTVLEYANALQTFPTNIIASMLGFAAKPYLETPGAEREAVKVQF